MEKQVKIVKKKVSEYWNIVSEKPSFILQLPDMMLAIINAIDILEDKTKWFIVFDKMGDKCAEVSLG